MFDKVVVAQVFAEQVSADQFPQALFYLFTTAAVFAALAGMCLVDAGLVRRKNVLDTCMQKILGSLIGGGSFAIVGYGIWNWQYNQALGVPNPLGESISSWWIGGDLITTFAQNIDPAVLPQAEVMQIFLPFNMAFAAIVCAFVHSVGIERMKASAFYVMSAVIGGVVFPFVLYLTWGSVSPLTTRGLHDFVGVFPLYIFVGVWGLVLAWRLGPRLGAFVPHPRTVGPSPHNMGLTAIGVPMFMFAISAFAMGCCFFLPDEGAFGISYATTGLGTTLMNIVTAFCAGAFGGLVFGYLSRNVVVAMTGPLAGWVAIGSGADVLDPLQVVLIASVAPGVVWAALTLVARLRIDEGKIIAIGLGAGVFGTLAVGFLAWGTPTGGYPGITEGRYALQGAEITPLWQLAGVAATAAIALLSAVVVIGAIERTVGLRVGEQAELDGLDLAYWGVPGVSDDDHVLAPPSGDGDAGVGGTPAASSVA